jgi:hypothetical protein
MPKKSDVETIKLIKAKQRDMLDLPGFWDLETVFES